VSAGKKLVAFVHVNGVAYGPNDDVPAEVAKLITNPKAWGGEVPSDSVEARTAASLDPAADKTPPAPGDSGASTGAAAKKAAAKKAPAKSTAAPKKTAAE